MEMLVCPKRDTHDLGRRIHPLMPCPHLPQNPLIKKFHVTRTPFPTNFGPFLSIIKCSVSRLKINNFPIICLDSRTIICERKVLEVDDECLIVKNGMSPNGPGKLGQKRMFTGPVEPLNSSTLDEKPGEENEPAQNFVTCIHIVKLGGTFCSITVTWAKTLISHTLYITVENPHEDNHYTCKIDLKTWQFWGKKGLKTFQVAEKRVDVFWDLRSAKFTTSPEPNSDYYVAIVSEKEVVLLLGDQKNEAFRRTKSRPALEDACLVHKKEIVFAKKCFCTKTTLGDNKKEHNIIIESSLSGPYDPEMWISVDGLESIRVPNLHWRFRGNETILVGDLPVQILWDVHDWLYSGSHSGAGIFVFRRGGDESEFVSKAEDFGSSDLLAEEPSSSDEFCHFLYAWRTE